jgi:hypothetical protein
VVVLSPALFLNKLGAALGAIEDGSNFLFFMAAAVRNYFPSERARGAARAKASNQL